MSPERDCSDLGGRSFRWGRRPKSRCAWFDPSRQLLRKGRSTGCGIPGAMTSRGGADTARGTCGSLCYLDDALECRSTWLTGYLPVEGPASRMGGNCWSRGRKVRKLLRFGWVECRLSSAPPISVKPVLVPIPAMAMSRTAHCLIRCESRRVQVACLVLEWSSAPSCSQHCGSFCVSACGCVLHRW